MNSSQSRLQLVDDATAQRIAELARRTVNDTAGRLTPQPNQFWAGLRDAGTELWLDTGDIDGASETWVKEFSALTTNNTLLNKEIQKGIYDQLVVEANKELSSLSVDQRVMEIAFLLNAHHALRLVEKFGAFVSVELHTSVAHDIEGTLHYARRFHQISPDRFIVKVPFTPEGLIATRAIRSETIPVNLTLGFSARQNYVATAMAHPSYVNVFLGRLNTYVSSNGLGDGAMVGEKATISSHREIHSLEGESTRQIAASMRGGFQVETLAGVDVMTMPLKVAQSAPSEVTGDTYSRVEDKYEVSLAPEIDASEVRLEKLWNIEEKERRFAASLVVLPPTTGEEFLTRARDAGVGDLFPTLTDEEAQVIAHDGKIPKHDKWREKIKKEEAAVDSLLNRAALAAFTSDQHALDSRIRGLIGE